MQILSLFTHHPDVDSKLCHSIFCGNQKRMFSRISQVALDHIFKLMKDIWFSKALKPTSKHVRFFVRSIPSLLKSILQNTVVILQQNRLLLNNNLHFYLLHTQSYHRGRSNRTCFCISLRYLFIVFLSNQKARLMCLTIALESRVFCSVTYDMAFLKRCP